MGDNLINEDLRIGVYICHCGSNIAGVIDPAELAEWASRLPGVVRGQEVEGQQGRKKRHQLPVLHQFFLSHKYLFVFL